ncbi:MAG: hypothetical protein Q8S21_00855 [Candidatus Paracaedibacteraceae bacterium]|nr:hypothetical protein [Candidatus Paracaedibacteraceae bacterium]
MSSYNGGFPEYVPVAERRAKAAKLVKQLENQGTILNPVVIEGRSIAKTFWGKLWCTNLEKYSDYESRLPRGRTYARNGSVIDLKINPGEILAIVNGSESYTVSIKVNALPQTEWQEIVKECNGKIESVIELLQGKFSKGVMEIIAQNEKGLFPKSKEMRVKCNCYDYASMCKHVAAALYGVGHRLDESPEELFTLRQVNHMDLVDNAQLDALHIGSTDNQLDGDLSALFGIDLADMSGIKLEAPTPDLSIVKPVEIIEESTKKKASKAKVKPKTKAEIEKLMAEMLR